MCGYLEVLDLEFRIRLSGTSTFSIPFKERRNRRNVCLVGKRMQLKASARGKVDGVIGHTGNAHYQMLLQRSHHGLSPHSSHIKGNHLVVWWVIF